MTHHLHGLPPPRSVLHSDAPPRLLHPASAALFLVLVPTPLRRLRPGASQTLRRSMAQAAACLHRLDAMHERNPIDDMRRRLRQVCVSVPAVATLGKNSSIHASERPLASETRPEQGRRAHNTSLWPQKRAMAPARRAMNGKATVGPGREPTQDLEPGAPMLASPRKRHGPEQSE